MKRLITDITEDLILKAKDPEEEENEFEDDLLDNGLEDAYVQDPEYTGRINESDYR